MCPESHAATLAVGGEVIVMFAIRSGVMLAVSFALVIGTACPVAAYLDPPWDDEIAPWLMDVEVVAPDDVWAVGMQERPAGKRWPLILHRDAAGWTEVRFPRDGWDADAWLVAVDAVAPDDVWAVGNSLPDWNHWSWWDPLVLHWDGVSWSRVDAPDPKHFVEIRDVKAVGTTRVFVVGRIHGDPLLLRWNGDEWARRPFPAGDELEGIDARSRGSSWAVGARWTDRAQAYRQRDGRWKRMNMPPLPRYPWTTAAWALHDVELQNAHRVWFAGSQLLMKGLPGDGYKERLELIVERWNGERIQVVPTPRLPGPFEEMMGIGSADGVLWAAGYRTKGTFGNRRAVVLIRRAGGWGTPTLPLRARLTSALMAVDGVGRRDVWAVGLIGDEPLILRGAGSSWVRERIGRYDGRATVWRNLP
jgi:hypothetical protein